MVGFIGAMAVEVENLLEQMEERQDEKIGMDRFSWGQLFGQEVVMAVCGPGKVNAALCAQSMIEHFHPDWVLNLGVAGAGEEGVSIGDMVIATGAVQHDMDTSPLGDPVGYVSKVGLVEFPCDAQLRERLLDAASQVPELKVHEGVIATGDQFICDGETRRRIHERFHSKAVEMEGAAVAQVCHELDVPFAVIRAISDNANEHAAHDFMRFVKSVAAQYAFHITRRLCRDLAHESL